MAQDKDTQSFLPTPVLLAPRDQHLQDGRSVTFSWEPVEGAAAYRMQVAADTTFEEIVLDEPVGQATSYTADAAFPTDGTTYFWRVLAEGNGLLSGEDQIQSFISIMPDEAHDTTDRPDENEDLGPAAELFSTAATDLAAEVTGDEEKLVAEEGELAIEEEGVATAQIGAIVVSIILAIVLIVITLFVIVANTTQGEMRYKVAERTVSGYPDLRTVETRAAEQLSQYEVLNAQEGVYRIPIDRAMNIMVNEAYDAPPATEAPSELSVFFED